MSPRIGAAVRMTAKVYLVALVQIGVETPTAWSRERAHMTTVERISHPISGVVLFVVGYGVVSFSAIEESVDIEVSATHCCGHLPPVGLRSVYGVATLRCAEGCETVNITCVGVTITCHSPRLIVVCGVSTEPRDCCIEILSVLAQTSLFAEAEIVCRCAIAEPYRSRVHALGIFIVTVRAQERIVFVDTCTHLAHQDVQGRCRLFTSGALAGCTSFGVGYCNFAKTNLFSSSCCKRTTTTSYGYNRTICGCSITGICK